MGFLDAVRSVFQKYATFSGRARRAEYWWFILFTILGSLVMAILDGAFFRHGMGMGMDGPDPFGAIFSLVILLPTIAVTVRRLHDVGRSGWWWWLLLVPLIGFLVILYWAIKPGDAGSNDYGPDPINPDAGLVASSVPRVPRS